MNDEAIYHICTAQAWKTAAMAGRYEGSEQDKADGFIHFSTRSQVAGTAEIHFAGRTEELVMLVVESGGIRAGLKWEDGRAGELFPHVYGGLPIECVSEVTPLKVDPDDGYFIFPFPTRDVDED